LKARSQEYNWHVTMEQFKQELEVGHCLILLDGLDEAPDEKTRNGG